MSSIASDAVSPITDYFSYESKKDALNAENSALSKLQFADPKALNDLATQYDDQRYKTGFSTQQQDDPTYSGLRTQGGQSILDQLTASQDPNNVANTSLKQLQTAATDNNTQMAPEIKSLEDRATQDMNEGSTLDPSFQNELVSAGLAKGGYSGYNLDGSSATGTGIRTLLGSEGVALQQSRAAEAQNLLGTASNLQAQRSNILGNLVTLDQNLRTSNAALGTNASSLGLSTVPSIGLSGADAANLQLGNTNLKNQVTMGKGKINASKALNSGNFINSEINSGARIVGDAASIFTGGIGGMMGGAGGAAGGAASAGGGGGFGFLNGFMNNNGVSYMPSSNWMSGQGASQAIAASPTSPNNWAYVPGT